MHIKSSMMQQLQDITEFGTPLSHSRTLTQFVTAAAHEAVQRMFHSKRLRPVGISGSSNGKTK